MSRERSLLATLILASLFFAATAPLLAEEEVGETRPILLRDSASSEWIPAEVEVWASEPSGESVPLLFLDDKGLTLTEMFIEGAGFLEGASCNGGSCAIEGVALNCPTSGGPTCEAGETCSCDCGSEGEGTSSTSNNCSKKGESLEEE